MIRIALPSASGKPWTAEVVRTVITGGAAGGVMRMAIAVMLLLPAAADAATIEVIPLKDKRFKSVITVSGKLNLGDQITFRVKVAQAPAPAIITFNSLGGLVAVGIDIGEQIRAKGLPTFVPAAMTCSSACALAWMAGSPRYVLGRVGFHAAYKSMTDHDVSSIGNAMAGAYLSKLGMQYPAIAYLTKASPDSMEWMTKSDAVKVGIVFYADDPTVFKATIDLPSAEVSMPRDMVKRVTDQPPPPASAPSPFKWPDVSHPDLLPRSGELKDVTKDTIEAVSNRDDKRDKLDVQLPAHAPEPKRLEPEAPCENGLSEIFGERLLNDALLHQLCAQP
jgi:hypothetical protein